MSNEIWESHAKPVIDQLNEKHHQWVASWLSEVIGWDDTKPIAEATGIDPKTIRQGRLDLQPGLEAYPAERVRREGSGRPPLKNKMLP